MRDSASETMCKKAFKRWTERASASAVAAWHQNSSQSVKDALSNRVHALECLIRDAAVNCLGLDGENHGVAKVAKRTRRVRKLRRKQRELPPGSPKKGARAQRMPLGLDSDTRCSLLLKMNIAGIAPGSAKRISFEKNVVEDVAG